MVASMAKTNAVRMLDTACIQYKLRTYEIDEADLSAERVADKLGMEPETVFKTLIIHGDRTGLVLALIPAGTELDLRALGEASGNKRMELVAIARRILKLTGSMRGAVTPLAVKKPYPVFIDETVELWPMVGISGGQRGLEALLAPADLIRIAEATLADIARQISHNHIRRYIMILLLDNYDSFTYNLYQYLCELGADVLVKRNDELTVGDVAELAPEKIVISPGPRTPHEAGISVNLIRELGGTTPILGVCLGHQAIGAAYGGAVVRAPEIMHGKLSNIHHQGQGVFAGLPDPFPATRYHSLIVRRDDLPDCLEVTAWTDHGIIMGLRHRDLPVEGVQFHPESIMTDAGKNLLRNFLAAPQHS